MRNSPFRIIVFSLYIIYYTSSTKSEPELVNNTSNLTAQKEIDLKLLNLKVCKDDTAICVLPVQCPAHFYLENSSIERCQIPNSNRSRICCRTGQNHTDEELISKRRSSQYEEIDTDFLREVAHDGQTKASALRSRESDLLSMKNPPILHIGSPSYGHFRNRRVLSDLPQVVNLANKAMEIALATRAFKDRQGLSRKDLEWNMLPRGQKNSLLKINCPALMKCPPILQKYRRIDGTCNNLRYPRWGAELTALSRLLPPSYEDGIWAPRLSSESGLALPSPRLISTTLFTDIDARNEDYTMMLSHFGQFISHDIALSIDITFPNGKPISCCTKNGSSILPPEHLHYACMPIEVPVDDPFYFKYDVRCMNFVRAALIFREDCSLGYAQQMNKVTHFIDGSMIYGSNSKELRHLRTMEGGRLKMFDDYGRVLLPLTKKRDSCLTMEKGSACFDAGDFRVNQNPALVALHTLFLREHNRIADELWELNPYWSDEDIFWETRQIVIAEIQVIVYKEFLPCLLGESTMQEFELNLAGPDSYSFDYNPEIEPSILNEFSSAAYRAGHSMIDGILKIYGRNRVEEMISLSEIIQQPSRMRKWEFFDEILTTLTTESVQQVDSFISESLTRYLFKSGNPFGIDLPATTIQRGRDHGLRPYNDYRQLIGLPIIEEFEEFGPEFGNKLSQLYNSVDDIDLWVGGLLEEKDSDDSVLGPTFRDIIADQFRRLKKGDRYFFENGPEINPGHFTLEQLSELKMKTSLSRIICDNADGIMLRRQASNAFKKPGVYENELIPCDSPHFRSIDLRYWKD
ncbi:oxidase/peroxidase [Holotrichia oblita]|uniref:Oxidase/peroxidase n=1 Tax=Holotrichia oblita TaxID=644536 RepID=A0ACB9SR26_HOLOL|nr:oxidase/peroxidase [Holotrichia oblita]